MQTQHHKNKTKLYRLHQRNGACEFPCFRRSRDNKSNNLTLNYCTAFRQTFCWLWPQHCTLCRSSVCVRSSQSEPKRRRLINEPARAKYTVRRWWRRFVLIVIFVCPIMSLQQKGTSFFCDFLFELSLCLSVVLAFWIFFFSYYFVFDHIRRFHSRSECIWNFANEESWVLFCSSSRSTRYDHNLPLFIDVFVSP